ncbi:hypothetical protein BJ138DRAFT_1018415, partial [Hygrophoropsis aurantiaca]
VPHPDSIQLPNAGVRPTGFWAVIVGQEVGIFYHWSDVARRTHNVSGNIQQKYPSFQEALQHYSECYYRNEVLAVPVPNGPFWPQDCTLARPHTPSTPSSSSSDGMWSQFEDLSVLLENSAI